MSSPNSDPRLSTGLATLVVATALVGMAMVAVVIIPPNHDIAWTLHVASRILAGERLYVTLIEINPPLIFWYALGAERLARALGADPVLVYHALSTLIVLAGIAQAAWLLRRITGGEQPYLRASFVVLFAWLAGPFAGFEFGQREHLLFATLVPYILGATAAMQGTELRGGAGFLGGLLSGFGLAMKPHFLPIAVIAEGAVLTRRGLAGVRRAQSAGLFTGLLSYGIAVLLFAPEYLRIARWGMEAYGHFFPARFIQDILFSPSNVVVLLGLWLLVRSPRLGVLEPVRWLSAAAVAVLTLSVWVQMKGWTYHWYPALSMAVLMSVLPAAALLQRRQPAGAGGGLINGRRVRWLAVCGGLVLLFAGFARSERTISAGAALAGMPYFLPDMRTAIQRIGGVQTILPLTTTMQATVPLVNELGLLHASRFAALWMLPAAYPQSSQDVADRRYHSPAEMGEVERVSFEGVIEDISRRPDVIVVDLSPPGYWMAGFDYLAYFGQSERFRNVMAEYTEVELVGRRYRIFAHTPANAH